MKRRLAAVLIADVVGYGQLSQIDEEGTRLRFQRDLKEVFEPCLVTHQGRLVKTMGDGLLVEFQSVVDAVHCAVEIQRDKLKRNATEPPEQRLTFRIGINLGDIIVEGEDIQGDGVNIADRLQALAQPGGIVISGTVYDHVKTKLPVRYGSLGERKVKSIASALKLRLVSGQGKADIAGGTRNLAAYEAYLRGRELEFRNSPHNVADAITYYRQAYALDPTFGAAMASMAWIYWNMDLPRIDALGLSSDDVDDGLHASLEAAAKNPSPTYYQFRSTRPRP
jgi:class 3 adenylate cyclase